MRYQLSAAVARWCTECTAWKRAALCAAAAMTAACGGSSSEERALPQQPTSATRRAANAAVPSSAKPACPPTGSWQLCSVIERLDRAGLAPRQQGRAIEAPLSVPGVSIGLGRSELRVFLYASSEARERDQATLDPAKYVTVTEPASMRSEPTLIVSENLLALLRSRSDHQRERVSDALTAGPPQRPGTKG